MKLDMLRPTDVLRRTGLSRTTVWRKVREGNFPPPIELGPNAIGWPEDVIDAWLGSQPRRTYGAPVEENSTSAELAIRANR